MKKIYILSLLIFIANFSQAQRNAVVGVSLGRAYYLGEINTSKQFYKTNFAYGAFYRYDINPRYSARANVLYTHLSADDMDFDSNYQRTRKASMNVSILDITLQAEFNFLPYDPTSRENNYTPFVTAGATYYLKDFAIGSILDNLAIPFGLGFKYSINKQIALGAEWVFRKTFRDDLDFKYPSPSSSQHQLGYQNDKDWYSIGGIFLTYKFKTYTKCPAFN